MVREAETQTSPTQRFTDRFERLFVPAVLVLVVPRTGPFLGSSWSEAFYRTTAVLVAASPCALAIATSSAVLAAVARAGQLGVLVKGGGPLENLGTLRAVAFDKTGTLTEGRLRLTDVMAAQGVDEQELLTVAVAVEARSDHRLATAVVRDGEERLDGRVLPAATGVTALAGRGVRATVDGARVLIGNTALFDGHGGLEPPVASAVGRLQAPGRTIMIVKRDGAFLGVLGLIGPPPAPASPPPWPPLREMGIRRAMRLSGDHQLVAESIAREVGLTEVWGDLLPADKVTAVERLRNEKGKVAMVGDGVNDAPALAHATVGIAMGAAGSDVALETADIALMGDDLASVPLVMGLSRKASAIIRQNLYISLGMVAFLIPATIVGFVGIGPAVVRRGLHARGGRQRPAPACLPPAGPGPSCRVAGTGPGRRRVSDGRGGRARRARLGGRARRGGPRGSRAAGAPARAPAAPAHACAPALPRSCASPCRRFPWRPPGPQEASHDSGPRARRQGRPRRRRPKVSRRRGSRRRAGGRPRRGRRRSR